MGYRLDVLTQPVSETFRYVPIKQELSDGPYNG